MQDVCKRGLHEQLLRTQADLRHAQEIAHLGIWAADMRTGIVETTSPETFRIFHLSEDRKPIRVDDLLRHIHPDDLPRVLGTLDRALRVPGARYDCEYRVMGAGGDVRYVHSLADAAPGADGKPTRIVGVIRDVTDIRRAQQEVRRLAFFDEITGLPNRVSLQRHLAAAFDAGAQAPLAVLAVDLAHFRQINLALGHLNGDRLLRDVAQRIGGLLGDDAYLARTANAQFTAVLQGTRARDAQQAADELVRA